MRRSLFAAFYFSLFALFYFIILPENIFASIVTCDSPVDGSHIVVYTGAGTVVSLNLTASVYDDNPTSGTREAYVSKDGVWGVADPPSYWWDGSSPLQGSTNPMPKNFYYDGSSSDPHSWSAYVYFPDSSSTVPCTSYFYLDAPCLNWSLPGNRPASCEGLPINPNPPLGTCTLCGQKDIVYQAGIVTACESGVQNCYNAIGQPGQYQQQYVNSGQCPVKVWDCQDTGITTYATNFTSYACNPGSTLCSTDILYNCPYSLGNVNACPANPPPPVGDTPTPTPTPGGATSTPTPTPFAGPITISVSHPTPTPVFSGTFFYSGKQTTQTGSNWFNPMLITLTTTLSSPFNYFVGFYDKNTGLMANAPVESLANLKNRLDGTYPSPSVSVSEGRKRGFLIASGTSVMDGLNGWYVWIGNQPSGGSWQRISQSTPDVARGVRDTSNNLLYTVYTVSLSPPQWVIKFDQNFGSKSFYTAGEVGYASGYRFLGNIPISP